MFGSKGLPSDALGLFTVLLIPVQILLIVFTMIGFSQGWNVEKEVPKDKAKRKDKDSSSSSSAEPATA
jgi:F0F1-type ATP synthase assembly protein I